MFLIKIDQNPYRVKSTNPLYSPSSDTKTKTGTITEEYTKIMFTLEICVCKKNLIRPLLRTGLIDPAPDHLYIHGYEK